jgi:hypothetical protein
VRSPQAATTAGHEEALDWVAVADPCFAKPALLVAIEARQPFWEITLPPIRLDKEEKLDSQSGAPGILPPGRTSNIEMSGRMDA